MRLPHRINKALSYLKVAKLASTDCCPTGFTSLVTRTNTLHETPNDAFVSLEHPQPSELTFFPFLASEWL